MRRMAIVAVLVGTLLVSARPFGQQGRTGGSVEQVDGRDAAAAEVLVRFRDTATPADLAGIAALTDARSMRRIGRGHVRRLGSRSLDVAALVSRLRQHPAVIYAEPNYILHAFAAASDPLVPNLWGLQNVGQAVNGGAAGRAGADIHAAQAWEISVGSTAHVVAVVDTGVDYTHPDLAANMWSAPAPFTVTIGDVAITCAAGSHGFNVQAMSCDPMDDNNHGTHVAGTIGASANGVGVAGVNWVARLMAVKFLNAAGSGTVADAVNGIEFAIQARQAFAATAGADVRVLSNSWGGRDFSQALLDQIEAANLHDMLFVAAAGNDGFSNDLWPAYPASYDVPNMIAVAATTNTDGRAWFSNYGVSSVDLGAPGVDILSTTVGGTYAYFSGTSMATPHVSGAAALVLSRCDLDTASLRSTLLSTVEPVASLASITGTGGRLDVNNAIHACIAPPDAPVNLTATAGNTKVTLAWAAGAGATQFSVKRSLTSSGSYVTLASVSAAKTYTDTAVINGTTYYYVVSAGNTLGQSADSNEAHATPKAPADLIVSALTAPATGGAGLPVLIAETTKNQGTAASIPTATRFYLSRNTLLDASDVLLGGVHAVPALSPGASHAASLSLDIAPDSATGIYYLLARADDTNLETETAEGNNIALRLLSIGPDLLVSALTMPATGAAGAAISVTDTVRNQGGGSAAPFAMRFYLSTNALVDANSVLLSGGRTVGALSPGATSSGTSTVALPSSVAAGAYYVIARADGNNVVAETQEGNNTLSRLVQIGGDLVVSALTVPAKAGAGAPIVVTDTTTNQGSGVAGASTTRFYVSTNVALDSGDTPLSGGRAVPVLQGGAASSGSASVVLPASLPTGSYYLIAKADGDGVAVETQEGNNTAVRLIQVGGDLTMTALTVPSRGAAGALLSIGDTIANTGGGSAGASVVRFYLSNNVLLDAGDVALPGGRAAPALAAGGTSSGSLTVSLPATVAAGSYYLIGKADGDDMVPETQEANNTLARAIAIGPDLITSGLTTPATVVAGSAVSITDVVQNAGAAPAAASTTRFYLSSNVGLDPSDTQLAGGRAVPPLAAGTSSTGSGQVTIPAATLPGTYYLFAKADGDEQVAEGQEGNNVTLRVIKVVAAP